MKGMQGLIVAGMLGVLGVALNWIYLQGKTKDVASIAFLGVAAGETIELGQPLKPEKLVAVKIPERHAGNLKDFVYLYEDLGTLAGVPATRRYEGGELILRGDAKRPPPELKLAEGEEVVWIPVNTNSFVPELIDPGDEIYFVVPQYDSAATVGETMERFGPFRVGSLGTRLASRRVAEGNRMQSTQERLVGILVDQNNELEKNHAETIHRRVLSGSYQDIGVVLHKKAE